MNRAVTNMSRDIRTGRVRKASVNFRTGPKIYKRLEHNIIMMKGELKLKSN